MRGYLSPRLPVKANRKSPRTSKPFGWGVWEEASLTIASSPCPGGLVELAEYPTHFELRCFLGNELRSIRYESREDVEEAMSFMVTGKRGGSLQGLKAAAQPGRLMDELWWASVREDERRQAEDDAYLERMEPEPMLTTSGSWAV